MNPSNPELTQAIASGTEPAPPAIVPPHALDAAASDPRALGYMQGFPPPPDKVIRFDAASRAFPKTRWSFSHYRELMPTRNVWRGAGAASELPRAEQDLDRLTFTLADGSRMSWPEMLAGTYTDGIVVLHRGRVIYERYFGALQPELPHIGMSVTKSFVGTLAAMLADEGRLDPGAPVVQYLPELSGSAYGDARVRHLMDMTVGLRFSEDYVDPNAEVRQYALAAGLLPRPVGYQGPDSIYGFLKTLRKQGEHDEAFAYKTVNTEVLAWIVRRVADRSLAQLLSERIWQPLGAEHDAYFTLDGIGTEVAGAGLNTTLRDLARFGEMMRNDGRFNGRQIVPAAVVADIRRGGDRELFARGGWPTLPGYSYRHMWWVSHGEHGVFQARGIHGQRIYVDPAAELTVARYASHPIASNPANDPLTHPAFEALAAEVMRW